MRTVSALALVTLALLAAVTLTSQWWTVALAESLVCSEQLARSDAMLIENFDPSYLLFEQAATLERAGLARTTFVPVEAVSDPKVANAVSVGIAEVMARQARLRAWTPIVITQVEPITLNSARQIRDRLIAERITSVIVIAPGFRSRRSALVYQRTLVPSIAVHCVPVFGASSPGTWTRTWHGVQAVVMEFVKLQYYRFYVLPSQAG